MTATLPRSVAGIVLCLVLASACAGPAARPAGPEARPPGPAEESARSPKRVVVGVRGTA